MGSLGDGSGALPRMAVAAILLAAALIFAAHLELDGTRELEVLLAEAPSTSADVIFHAPSPGVNREETHEAAVRYEPLGDRVCALNSAVEELLDLVHPALGARVVARAVLRVDAVELAQQLALPRGQA